MSEKKKHIREKFRNAVFSRDDFKCKICGYSGKLDAHHISSRNCFCRKFALLPHRFLLCCFERGRFDLRSQISVTDETPSPSASCKQDARQRTFALGYKSQVAIATGNIYCRSQIYKKNVFTRRYIHSNARICRMQEPRIIGTIP